MSAMHATLYRMERSSERLAIGRASTLRGSDGEPVDVQIDDLSATGCRLSIDVALAINEEVVVGLPGVGMRRGRIIWTEANQAGLAFNDPISLVDVEETRTSVPLTHVDFRRLPSPPAIADPAIQEERFTPRRSLAIIFVAALAAWGIVGAAGAAVYLLLG